MNRESTKEQACKLDSCLFFSTTKLARAFGKIADEAFLKTGLSPSHALLLYLVNLNGGIQQKEIGETLHLTPSTVTRLIEKLKRKNLVSKKSEGKNVYLGPTPEGLALQDVIMKSWNQLHNGYKDILTEEETVRFIEISGKLLEKLDGK
ncbi:MarR family winged helix-turn-helix transcriptional regulator [Clostridium sp. Marseille-P2415]|uniref:MarR family winged helix-turn-helix transcriptional regulator n=1 Tax=Clostridium sp. Marseille-P2415 TaxID=1805471 RepID=UPI0009884B38|nr:MarR family winged helix-turn-helix transcriptional regulator [Clostridium sp. Marseille-P2415]